MNPQTGRPVIEIISPQRGSNFETNSFVDVTAIIGGDHEVSEAVLLWHYNGERYLCPTEGPYVNCQRNEDEYVWSVSLGSAAERAFQVEARNTLNRKTTPRRSIHVRRAEAGPAPSILQLEPEPNTRWLKTAACGLLPK